MPVHLWRREKKKSGHHTWNILDKVDCNSENLVYLIQCDKESCAEKKVYMRNNKANA